jgi:CubicO group peptidase (beta-lactamase class C family)
MASTALAQGPKPLERANLEPWLDGFVPSALRAGDIAGAVVVVIKDGQVLLQKGYGLANVARRIPMDPDRSVIGVGSVSKLFAWTAVMQQVEAGKLDLDRDVNAYLDVVVPATFPQSITLRHLMTHTAGFGARTFQNVPAGAHARSLAEYIRGTPVPVRMRPPGQVAAYSNYGAMLAGYIVERVSGEPFVDYVDRHILSPLGMTHSSFRRPIPPELARDLAPSYSLASGEPEEEANEEPAGDPSGHLLTTASDLSHFLLAHLENGSDGGHQILRPETVRTMHTPTFWLLPGLPGTALGWFRLDRNGHEVLWHGGDIASYHTAVHLLPAERVGFFIGLNSSGVSHGALSESNALRTAVFNRFMDRYFPAPPVVDPPTAATALEHARLAAGEYTISQRPAGDFMEAVFLLTLAQIDLSITANPDGTIETPGFLHFENGRPQRWRETGPFVWREVGGPAELRMRVDGGRVTGFAPSDLPALWLNERTSTRESRRLNLPLLLIAVIGLAFVNLGWLVAAVIRRRRRARLELPPRERRAARLTRVAAGLGLADLLGWGAVIAAGLPQRVGAEPWIRLVQLVGLVCVAAAVASLWSAWVTATGHRTAVAKLASVVTALAMVELVWFSFTFKLISTGLNY